MLSLFIFADLFSRLLIFLFLLFIAAALRQQQSVGLIHNGVAGDQGHFYAWGACEHKQQKVKNEEQFKFFGVDLLNSFLLSPSSVYCFWWLKSSSKSVL